jgi:hypothetical protein
VTIIGIASSAERRAGIRVRRDRARSGVSI